MMLATIPPQNIECVIPIEKVVSVTNQDTLFDANLFILQAMEDYSMVTPHTAIRNKISEIGELSDDWDGFDANAVPKLVLKNTFKFIDTLCDNGVFEINPDDITPTPYGSIVIDLTSPKGLVSLEIGQSEIGFFTEFIDEKDFESEGEETDFRFIPKGLQEALDVLYGV